MAAKRMTKLVDLFSIDKESVCEFLLWERLNTGEAGFSCAKDPQRQAVAYPCDVCTKEDYENCPLK